MTKPKPQCPRCASADAVRTVGGGTRPMYRYMCTACEHTWQCVPPHRVAAVGYAAKITKPMRSYRCSLCLQLKRGHTCTGFAQPATGCKKAANSATLILPQACQRAGCAERTGDDSRPPLDPVAT
jgi:hypothetical protein